MDKLLILTCRDRKKIAGDPGIFPTQLSFPLKHTKRATIKNRGKDNPKYFER
jgi:hypothetical protein